VQKNKLHGENALFAHKIPAAPAFCWRLSAVARDNRKGEMTSSCTREGLDWILGKIS